MIRRLMVGMAFAAGLTGCAVPAATGRLLDAALDGLDRAVANQKAAQGAIAAGLDAQQDALRSGVEADLRSVANEDKVALDDAVALFEAYHQQSQALTAARTRQESDARTAADNLAATRELIAQARNLVLVSTALDANVARLAVLFKTGLTQEETEDDDSQ